MSLPDNFFDCDYFALFGVSQQVAPNPDELRARYQSLQAAAHPDRFASAPESQKRAAMQMAGRINDAYRTLSDPLLCAAYILSLRGVIAFAEDNTAMPPDFLMQQIEWREALEDAADEDARSAIYGEIAEVRDACAAGFTEALTGDDNDAAADHVRKWKYLENLLDGRSAFRPDGS